MVFAIIDLKAAVSDWKRTGDMGVYLNSISAYTLYKNEVVKTYFVDKTQMLEALFPFAEEGGNYICIARPRRFGKTVMANMIASFFSKAHDSGDVFDSLYIAKTDHLHYHLNQYQVIYICFNELPRRCRTYEQYISRIEGKLVRDLRREYPDVEMEEDETLWNILTDIYTSKPSSKFIFVLDEWDFIFHRDFVTEGD